MDWEEVVRAKGAHGEMEGGIWIRLQIMREPSLDWDALHAKRESRLEVRLHTTRDGQIADLIHRRNRNTRCRAKREQLERF